MNALVSYEHPVSDMERMARAIAGSKLFGIANVEQALALCLVAQAEGRHPASAAQDYHIIQGRPAKKADAMLRDFLTAGGKVEWHTLSDTIADATFSHPSGGALRIDWTMERAKQAQLATAMWTKYPRQMLRARVVSEGVRSVYPMATSGMYVPEEVQDFEPQRGTQSLPAPSDPDPAATARDITPDREPPARTPAGGGRKSSPGVIAAKGAILETPTEHLGTWIEENEAGLRNLSTEDYKEVVDFLNATMGPKQPAKAEARAEEVFA